MSQPNVPAVTHYVVQQHAATRPRCKQTPLPPLVLLLVFMAIIVPQVPHLDARAATLMSIKKRGVPKSLACLGLGLLDRLATAVGLPPIYLPLVGPVGSLAFMQLNEFETKEYFSKHPSVYQGAWTNQVRQETAMQGHEVVVPCTNFAGADSWARGCSPGFQLAGAVLGVSRDPLGVPDGQQAAEHA